MTKKKNWRLEWKRIISMLVRPIWDLITLTSSNIKHLKSHIQFIWATIPSSNLFIIKTTMILVLDCNSNHTIHTLIRNQQVSITIECRRANLHWEVVDHLLEVNMDTILVLNYTWKVWRDKKRCKERLKRRRSYKTCKITREWHFILSFLRILKTKNKAGSIQKIISCIMGES